MESGNKFKSHVNISSFAKSDDPNKIENQEKEKENDEEKEFKPIPISKKGNSTNLRMYINEELRDKVNSMNND